MGFKIGSWSVEETRNSWILRFSGVEELEDREKNHKKLSTSYKPNCTDEWLELIHDIGFDYDGYNTVEGLKELIDELVDMATEARKCLHKEKSNSIELPCKVGDTVYVLTPKINTVFKGEVRKMLFNHKNELVICVARNEHSFNVNGNYKLSSFGKTVFLTKEEAEKALSGEV